MIPWDYTKHTYTDYLRLQPGIYPYKVYFYEGEPVELNGKTYDLSCKDVFPNSIADDKEEFCEMVQYVMDLFNYLNIGIEFVYQGHDVVTEYKTEFRVNSANAIVYYNGFPWGGLGGFFPNKKEIGVAMHIGKTKDYNRYLGELVHEMLHCLGIGHKFTSKTVFTGKQVSKWIIEKDVVATEDGIVGISKDSVHGVDVIYKTDTKFKVSGTIQDREKFSHAEAFLFKWHKDRDKREMLYQTTIDSTGYYEFRLRSKEDVSNGFKILCVGRDDKGWCWNGVDRQSINQFRFWHKHVSYKNIHLDLRTDNSDVILENI